MALFLPSAVIECFRGTFIKSGTESKISVNVLEPIHGGKRELKDCSQGRNGSLVPDGSSNMSSLTVSGNVI